MSILFLRTKLCSKRIKLLKYQVHKYICINLCFGLKNSFQTCIVYIHLRSKRFNCVAMKKDVVDVYIYSINYYDVRQDFKFCYSQVKHVNLCVERKRDFYNTVLCCSMLCCISYFQIIN